MDPLSLGLIAGGTGLLNYFGQKDQADAQRKSAEAAQAQLKAAQDAARGDLAMLFPKAAELLGGGYRGALGVMQQTTPQQAALMTQGNRQAQQTLRSAMPQMQAALLGGNVDLSSLMQPTAQPQIDYSFLDQAVIPEITANVPSDLIIPHWLTGGN